MKNLDLYEKFRKVPEEAKRKIKGGRINGFTDINPMWRIKRLTEEFGPCGSGWYYKPVKEWIEQVGNEYAAFVDIELYVKYGDEWSMPIPGSGGSKLATVEKSGIFVSDECYKMATTDAISVACKQLGIGADVYFESDKTKYNQSEPESKRKINESEKKLLQGAAERTGMNLEQAIKKHGGKSINDITHSVYMKWMVTLACTDSRVPVAPDADTDIPEDIEQETPFE